MINYPHEQEEEERREVQRFFAPALASGCLASRASCGKTLTQAPHLQREVVAFLRGFACHSHMAPCRGQNERLGEPYTSIQDYILVRLK